MPGGPEIEAATLKLPPFWPADPELWFAQVEAQFTTRGIQTDATKHSYLVASLTPEVAAEVRDLLIAPPAGDNKYASLKEAVIKRTTSTAEARIKQLLHAEQLDGRKPTQLLRRMRQLIGNHTNLVPNDLLKQLFIDRLPSQVQGVLAASSENDLDKMADLADKVLVAVGPQVCTVDTANEVSELRRELQELKQILRGRASDPGVADRGSRNRSKTPKRTPDNADLCWFHFRFGEKAKKCREPCSFQQGNGSGSR